MRVMKINSQVNPAVLCNMAWLCALRKQRNSVTHINKPTLSYTLLVQKQARVFAAGRCARRWAGGDVGEGCVWPVRSEIVP